MHSYVIRIYRFRKRSDGFELMGQVEVARHGRCWSFKSCQELCEILHRLEQDVEQNQNSES